MAHDRDPGTPSPDAGGASLPGVVDGELCRLLGRTDGAIYALDVHGHLRWASPAMLDLLGIGDVGVLGGRTFDELWGRLGRRRVFLRRLREAGQVEEFPRQLRAVDGTSVCVRESRYARRGPTGRLQGYLGIMQRSPATPRGAVMTPLTRDFDTGAYGPECLEQIDEDGEGRSHGGLRLECSAPRGDLRPGDLRALSHLVIRSTRAEDLLVALGPARLALVTVARTLPALKALAERIAARVDQETGLRVDIHVAVQEPGESVREMLERAASRPEARIRSRHPAMPAGRFAGTDATEA